MKIDRERFLLMTTVLAAGVGIAPACTTPEPEERLSQLPMTASTIVLPRASAAPPASGSPNPYKGTPVTAQACDPALNKIGKAPACALQAPGPSCESFSDTKQECPTLNALLKPRVAAAAIE